MFKRPEELIVLSLGLLWLALTYFISNYMGLPTYTVFLITGLTLAWVIVCFSLWQKGFSPLIWPFFLGFLVACWWPFLDWFAIKDIIVPGSESEAIIITKPWYATWSMKLILAATPIILGYFIKWKQSRKYKNLTT